MAPAIPPSELVLGRRPSAKALGGLLRALRTAAGVSQAELGKRIGLAFQNVSRLESGRHEATVHTVNAYVRALGAELVLTVRPRPEPE